ncbi:MAG: ATP synthase F1 subunit gamma [Bacteroidetes bacterium]|nr:MAG: ATP synthase F1 subunit gamma [Bacteroidota bacterium]REK00688.1 MAG: ATP synthase F1 subunit gamma [Bacteroidota bacterium]REK35190.1 MAG: ATP synthase F1 subunit gamma [Bacteroidota bacterium]REK48267.1 MAG: ATP synthase F1 subunit gamma [Bacteroidota bacterium]
MPNLKEVRNRISSVISTQQITKAMKMVSAAKLRRAQDAILLMRPYAAKLREIMENISGTLDSNAGGAYAAVRPVQKVLIIAVSSNRGLCGAFNANINRTINRILRENYAAQVKDENVKVLCIGKKSSEFFSKTKHLYYGNHNDIYNDLNFESVSAIADEIMKEFASGAFDRIELVYNQFKNAAVQIVQHEQVLPISPPKGNEKAKVNDYIFEPGKEELVLELIPKTIRIQLYKAILDSNASEHGARMTAMSKATDNAGELLRDLKLSYNKARQAAITGEILEIVAGAEALNN